MRLLALLLAATAGAPVFAEEEGCGVTMDKAASWGRATVARGDLAVAGRLAEESVTFEATSSATLLGCEASVPGTMAYNGVTKTMMYCDGSDWRFFNAQAIVKGAVPAAATVAEASGTRTLSFVLNASPTVAVTVTPEFDETRVAAVSPPSLTFGLGDWESAQVVTATMMDNDVDEDEDAVTVVDALVESGDVRYHFGRVTSATLTVTDDDVAAVDGPSATSLVLAEASGEGVYTLRLLTEPQDDVTISATSSDVGEVTTSAPVTFTPSDYSIAQTLTTTAVDDDEGNTADATVSISHTISSSDSRYQTTVTIDPVAVVVEDDDTAAVTSSATAIDLFERQRTAGYELVLETQPTNAVTVSVVSSDTNEVTVLTPTVVFSPANYQVPATVSVEGIDNGDIESDPVFSLSHGVTSGDSKYQGLVVADVAVKVLNDDFLWDGQERAFTSLDGSGATGPTSTAAYSGTPLDGEVVLSGGIQQWTVPSTSLYRITMAGGAGGGGHSAPGSGAEIIADVVLLGGQTLNVLVGQVGLSETSEGGGGGGGSFVWTSDGNDLLVAAGGGAGAGDDISGASSGGLGANNVDSRRNGQIGQTNAFNLAVGTGGPAGNAQGSTSSSWNGGGGAGWLSNGQTQNNHGQGGKRPLEGGFGGQPGSSQSTKAGGFGGGGSNGFDGGGGGGGYTGGAGATHHNLGNVGSGGGSFVKAGEDTIGGLAGANAGNGYVRIDVAPLPAE